VSIYPSHVPLREVLIIRSSSQDVSDVRAMINTDKSEIIFFISFLIFKCLGYCKLMCAKLIKKYEKRKGFPSFIEENPYLVKYYKL
jgi:hypothetical protein